MVIKLIIPGKKSHPVYLYKLHLIRIVPMVHGLCRTHLYLDNRLKYHLDCMSILLRKHSMRQYRLLCRTNEGHISHLHMVPYT